MPIIRRRIASGLKIYQRVSLDYRARLPPSTGKAAPAPSDLAEADEGLFAALKDLRMELARQRGVPAYVIFSDRTLVDMAGRKPADDIAFAEVFGVGEAKLNDFAEPFMAVISGFS